MGLRYLEYMGLVNSIDRSMMTLHSLRIVMKRNLRSGSELGVEQLGS